MARGVPRFGLVLAVLTATPAVATGSQWTPRTDTIPIPGMESEAVAITTIRGWYHHGRAPTVVLLTHGTTEASAAEREARGHLTMRLEGVLGEAGLSVITVAVTDWIGNGTSGRERSSTIFADALTQLSHEHRWQIQGIVGFAEGARVAAKAVSDSLLRQAAVVALSPTLHVDDRGERAAWLELAEAQGLAHARMLIVVGGCGPDIPRASLAGVSIPWETRIVTLMHHNAWLIRMPRHPCGPSRGPYYEHSSEVPEIVVDWLSRRVTYPE